MKPKEKTEAEKRAEAEKAAAEKKAAAERAAAEAAAKKIAGAFGKGTQMGNKGTGTTGSGLEGSPTGNSSEGKSGGVGGYGTFDLNGRSLGSGGLPMPVYNVQDEGRVVVTITVNPAGQVISTSINKRTNTVNASLRKAAEEAARKARFNQVDRVNNQTGTITYYFKTEVAYENNLCILAEGFEEVEALTPVDVLRRAGLPVKTVSVTGVLTVNGAHGVPVVADMVFEEVKEGDAEMIVLPGGLPGATNLDAHEGLGKLIMTFAEAGRPLSAICAAPLVYGKRGLLKGKKVTCYPGFEKYLEGAEYTAALVEKDGNFITGKGPGAAMAFSFAIAEKYVGAEKVTELKQDDDCRMNRHVIIVAGGKGLRMGGDIPKQFLPVGGKPVLMRTIEAFYAFDSSIHIILVLPVSQQATGKIFVKRIILLCVMILPMGAKLVSIL